MRMLHVMNKLEQFDLHQQQVSMVFVNSKTERYECLQLLCFINVAQSRIEYISALMKTHFYCSWIERQTDRMIG